MQNPSNDGRRKSGPSHTFQPFLFILSEEVKSSSPPTEKSCSKLQHYGQNESTSDNTCWRPQKLISLTNQTSSFPLEILQKYVHNLPIYTRHINYNINHVTAKFIRLHIHRRTVCCNVDFADNIKEKSFFNT